jgi:hypothetical protein
MRTQKVAPVNPIGSEDGLAERVIPQRYKLEDHRRRCRKFVKAAPEQAV